MNHTASVPVSNEKKQSSDYRRFVFAGVVFANLLLVCAYLFRSEILDFLVTHMPMDDGKTSVYYADLLNIVMYEIVWVEVLLIFFLILYSYPSTRRGFEFIQSFMVYKHGRFVTVVVLMAAALLITISFLVLKEFPNSSDEYVYVYQAQTLSEGKLWEKAHAVEKSFGFNHIANKDGISVGRFPIGWPLILALFIFLGVPAALVNPILGIATLYVFFRFVREFYGNIVAGWSLICLAVSGFFIFNSASFFSHTSCLLETLIFVYCMYAYLKTDKLKYALLAGLSLGLIMLIRYYTAVLLFVPFAVLIFYQYRLRAFKLFFFMGFGAIPCLVLFFWYNYSLTGNIWQPVTVWAYHGEGLGFINGHNFFKGIEHIIRRFAMFIYWCSPVFLIYYLILLLKKLTTKDRAVAVPEDYLFLMFIVGYFFYYEIGGNQYGPRFYYEAFPFLIIFVVARIFNSENQIHRLVLYATIAVMVMKIPVFAWRENQIVEERKDVYRLAEELKLTNAVVLLANGTSPLRPMPVGDLTRNDATFNNDVLYAVDDDRYNDALRKHYSERSFYRYTREPKSSQGKLVRVK